MAVAVGSVPAEWYDDDKTLVTIIDVLNKNAERAKRR